MKQSAGAIQVASKKGRSRKAANLAELQRYFTAAAEAASEVLNEGPLAAFDDREDLAKIAEAGIKPLDSPRCTFACNNHNFDPRSRMVAVSLASGNIRFRDKLREKLEATGGVACKIHIGTSANKSGPLMPDVRTMKLTIHEFLNTGKHDN